MNLLDDIKNKLDASGDGKLGLEDLKDLQHKHPEMTEKLNPLLSKADTNGDGKVDLSDLTSVIGGSQGGNDLLGKLSGMFKK